MKKIVAALVVVALSLCPLAAMAENWYLTEGERLMNRILSLAADDSYTLLYSGSEEIQQMIDAFAESDYSEVTEARMLYLPDGETAIQVLRLIGALSGEETLEISDTAMSEIGKRLPNTIASLVNSRYSVTWLAAANVLQSSETYIQPENFQPGVLLLEYPGEYAAMIAFSKTGEDTITAMATPIHSGFVDEITEDMPLAGKIAFEMLFRRIDLLQADAQ